MVCLDSQRALLVRAGQGPVQPGHLPLSGAPNGLKRRWRPNLSIRLRKLEHENEYKDTHSGAVAPDGRLLAGRELSLSRSDLSLRQSAAETTADARGCETHAAGALGHDSRTEFHLRTLESRNKEIRPRQ